MAGQEDAEDGSVFVAGTVGSGRGLCLVTSFGFSGFRRAGVDELGHAGTAAFDFAEEALRVGVEFRPVVFQECFRKALYGTQGSAQIMRDRVAEASFVEESRAQAAARRLCWDEKGVR